MWRICLILVTASVTISLCPVSKAHAQTVSERIDVLIEAQLNGPAADPTSDEEFCRRIYLDFAGRIPTVKELETFTAAQDSGKRSRLIDRLISSDEFPRRMRDVWHVHLMERLGDNEEWARFLETSFAENRPWQELVQLILRPSEDQESLRGGAYFLTRRLENYGQNPVDLPGLTRDVGRLFLGVDLQCAQCHDHLFIDDYKQVDFQGLHTFLAHTYIRQDLKFPAVGEKLVNKKTDFMSVFLKEPHQTGPRLPFGREVEIPVFVKGEEYLVAPDRKTKFQGTPKFSPLTVLAESLATLENPAFVHNAVNRWWFHLIGRGLVHPLDLTHSGNPPSHPEVLHLLSEEFVTHQGDVRWLVRTIANSRTYQRSSRWSHTDAPPPAEQSFAIGIEKPLSAEQLVMMAWQATGHEKSPPKNAVKEFTAAFGNPPREPEEGFSPSVKAALFLSHNSTVLGWVESAADTLPEAAGSKTFRQEAAYAWRQVLSRTPTDEELEVAERWNQQFTNSRESLKNLVWSLMNTTEFCLNH